MPITKRIEIDHITIVPSTGTVLWCETTIVEEDGKEIARSTSHTSREAFDDVNPVPAEVATYRAQIVTPEIKALAIQKRDAALTQGTNPSGKPKPPKV